MTQAHIVQRLTITLFALLALQSSALVQSQYSEDFDTNWPGAPWGATTFLNVTNAVSGWSINSNSISSQGGFTTPSNACFFGKIMSGQAWLLSPALTNGIGAVIFDAKGSASLDGILSLESSYDGISWFTNLVTTNRNGAWAGYTNIINSMSNQYLRIRRLDNNNFNFAIDTVRITYPTPSVTISNVVPSPLRPTDQDPVTISANVAIRSVPDTFAMTNYWREWPTTNWTLIAMTSNSPTLYTAASAIPGKSIGTRVDYYAQATFTGNSTTNTATSSATNYIVVPKSSYTNLAVIGQVTAPLRNGANYQWQGVIQVTNANPTFQFQGISNAVATTWGDVNQTVTNTPLYGQAEVTSSNIILYTSTTGAYLFSLNETNLNYSVIPCAYENFNSWTSTTYNAFGTYTNPVTGWTLVSGNSSNDAAIILEGTGRSAVVETNGWIQTPYLSNGVGQISFWYRNWPTNGAPAGKFIVQSSDSTATNWITLGTVTNIVSTNYLFCSVGASDPASKYVRIQNSQTTAAARLCFDEVAVAPPGAGVSGISTTPTNATIVEPITIAITLTPFNGASISSVTGWYRVGTNGTWESGQMTSTDGVHYALSAPIVGVPAGSLQYAVLCSYSGFQASSPIFFPASGTNTPTSVTVSEPDYNRKEYFDTNWPGAPWGATTFLNVTNSVSGWLINSNSISSQGGNTTPSNACFLGKNMSGQAWLLSSALTNGIGAVMFDTKGSASLDGILSLESSSDGTSWLTNVVTTNRNGVWAGYTNIINSISNQYLRIRRLDNNNFNFAIDTVRITYPPATVTVTNLYINPGYPVAGQAFTASCDVVTLNPLFPAYNINPVFYGSTFTGAMTRAWVSGATNHYTLPVSLASVTRDTPYSYYVRATFDGYYGSAAENQSPKTSVIGIFTNRTFTSQYSTIGTINNGTTNTTPCMLTNGLWQSIVSFIAVTSSTFNLSFQGSGYSAGTGYLTNSIQWGNSNNWKTTVPLNDFAGANQTNISLAGSFIGDYLIRFNEQTGEYLVQQCAFQDFESWNGAGAGSTYVKSDNVNFPLTINNFDAWKINTNQIRSEDFSSDLWSSFTQYTNAANGGSLNYPIFGSKINAATVQTTDSGSKGVRFIAQSAMWPTPNAPAMRGIGTVKFDYKLASTNAPATFAVYAFTDPTAGTNLNNYGAELNWKGLPNATVSGATNTGFITKIIALNTNTTVDLIFSQDSGITNAYLDNLYVDEWYADSQTNGGWITSEGFIEQRSSGNLCCKFDITRSDLGPDQQYIVTPVLSNGANSISFNYCGGNTTPISFNLDIKYGASSWSTLNSFTNSTTNYTSYSYIVGASTNNAQLRIRNTTPAPGILFLDDFKISAKIAGLAWSINNASVDETDPKYPPVARQYIGGACYLNSNRTANINFGDTTNAPDTNAMAYILSPRLSFGVGEISFWYRNWATAAPVAANLYIQTSTKDQPIATNLTDWSTVYVLSNIVNIADYQYCQLNLYDTTSKWVRLYNDISTNAGRVCLDNVLIAAPMASSFAMSNLTVSPLIPLYTNTVDVMVDIYQLFLNPTNITLSALYGTSPDYAGLTNAALTSLPMTCIASNLSTPGRWFRYKTSTPIPTNAIDTFVRYGAKASWGGYNAQAASPQTNSQFATSPTWYYPLNVVYGITQAYYIVYSCPTGAVWINEFNYDDWDLPPPQFVELCGPSGVSIGGWQLQMLNDSVVTVSQYRVTSGTVLPNSTNGFGFWVFGDSNVAARNQLLTNDLPFSGGLRLIRSCGVYEQSLCYSDSQANLAALKNLGFKSIGIYDDYWNGNVSLSLIGTGNASDSLVWTNGFASSAGSINYGETLIGAAQNSTPPTITIWSFRVNTNVWIECTRTNGWSNAPWYTTNLLYSNLWTSVTSFTNIPNASNDVLSFTRPPTSPVLFFKVVTTNGP